MKRALTAFALAALSAGCINEDLLNPMAAIIDGYRRAIILGVAPELPALALSAAVTIVLTYVALAVFKRAERTFADVI